MTAPQQALLDHLQVRRLQPDERPRYDPLIIDQHYLGNATLGGEQLRYVAESQGQWVALPSWRAAAFKVKAREAWIGWSARQ